MSDKILNQNLLEVMSERFGNYSKYVIQDRALPDARDGLKPVHRRILFSMFGLGLTNDKAYKKSARIVGEVIGKYHPHGDTSVYDAMVRLAQEWKMNVPLVDMHGNKGSVDGDSPAAMRYTETRLAKISSLLLNNIKKETVPFVLNFDDSEKEPVVLPARFPNLLVNGAIGIASGYSTNIPPHNLNEVIDAIIVRMKSPGCRLDSILKVLKAPDFPTGGLIKGTEDIPETYKTGKGKIVISSKYEIDHSTKEIIIHELPFEVNKSDLVRKIAEIEFDSKIPGIAEVRDDTDRTGMRIIVRYKDGANPDIIINYLLKHTDLQKNYNMQLVAIKDRKPMQMGVIELIDAYIEHQLIIETNKFKFELKKSNERKEIVEGLIKAIENIDKVIDEIKKSTNKKTAKEAIISKFKFTENQAEAIVILRLYRLTSTDIDELKIEKNELVERVATLNNLLSNEENLKTYIISKLKELKKEFGYQRRTKIIDVLETISIAEIDTIEESSVMVSITQKGYLKQTSMKSYNSVKHEEIGLLENDGLTFYSQASNHNNLFVILSTGHYIVVPIYKLEEKPWKENGGHINLLAKLPSGAVIVNAVIFKNWEDLERLYLITATRLGMIKKTSLIEFETSSIKSIKCMNMKTDDKIVSALITTGKEDLIITTRNGYQVRYSETEINPTSVKTGGIKSISLKNDDKVRAVLNFEPKSKEKFIVLSSNGYKILPVAEVSYASKSSKGSLVAPQSKSNIYKVITSQIINKESRVFVIPISKKKIEIPVNEGAKRHSLSERMTSPIKSKFAECFVENTNYFKDENNSKTKTKKSKPSEASKDSTKDGKNKKGESFDQNDILSFLDEIE